jgi:hypothetical protein
VAILDALKAAGVPLPRPTSRGQMDVDKRAREAFLAASRRCSATASS